MAFRAEPRKIPAEEHKIDSSHISPKALAVVRGLRDAGYEAFLVGGCVRDLLLGLYPKDFDVTTDAQPEEVRSLFRNARLIGRRFRLAHIRFGREIIEVATYRASPGDDDAAFDRSRQGRLLRDNVYGTQDEDALRRDFSINALYFDPLNNTVLDYVDGMQDLRHGVIRVIGNPIDRYREDPVRIIRAVRFSAKLDFRIDSATEQAIGKVQRQIRDVPPARLFDEVLKLYHHGAAAKTHLLAEKYGLVAILFPGLRADAGQQLSLRLVDLALENTDRRIRANKPVIAAFLFAVFLWSAFKERLDHWNRRGLPHAEAVDLAGEDAIVRQCKIVSIPRRISEQIRDIWRLQDALEQRAPRRINRTMENRRFRAAYDFLLLRGEIGEAGAELCDWWTQIQETDERGRSTMIRQLAPVDKGSRRGKRKRSRSTK